MNQHEAHVSDFRLDRLLAGELDQAEQVAIRAHTKQCPTCCQRLRDLTAEKDAFEGRALDLAPRRRKMLRVWAWGPVAALAAAATVLLMLRPTAPNRPEEGVRIKGSTIHLLLARGRPGALVPLASGDTIHPGDHLQAGYSAPQPGFGAVLTRDGAGEAFSYVPSNGETMVALPAGKELSFPESTILDDVIGQETILVLWCDADHPLDPMLGALRSGQPVEVPQGCEKRELVLDKRGI